MAHAERARRVGFDWLYVNPFHYPASSGSRYAIKDYDGLQLALETDTIAPIVHAVRNPVPRNLALAPAEVAVIMEPA